jgi:hypothetical protein
MRRPLYRVPRNFKPDPLDAQIQISPKAFILQEFRDFATEDRLSADESQSTVRSDANRSGDVRA